MSRVREWVIANLLIIVAVFAALMTATTIAQTIRIDGFRIDLPLLPALGPKGLKTELIEAEAKLAAFIKAREEANRLAQAARQTDEADIATRAKDTDNAINQSTARAAGATERFIAAGGLPDPNRCPSGPAATDPLYRAGSRAALHPAPQLDGAAPVPAVPETAIVRVTPEDVRICSANTIIAEESRDLLLGLEARTSSNSAAVGQQRPSSNSAATGRQENP